MRPTGATGVALTLLALASLMGSALASGGATFTNPVIEPVAADPSVIRAADGTWYLYATQDRWDDGVERYLPIFSSTDLVEWQYLGDTFALPPRWKSQGFLWAPDVSEYDDRFWMYYGYSTWGDPNPCIGLATADHPAGPWEDLGASVFCSEDIGVRNSIDPFVWSEDGERTLVWGSFHGIHAARLVEDGSAVTGELVRLADERFEGAYLIERAGWYYLFVSSGSCCAGAESTYITWVGRSEDLLGPYRDDLGRDLRYGGGRVVLFRNDDWVGPGHNAVVTDDAGTDWLVYHAIDPRRPLLRSGATRRPVLIDPIDWVDGWPVVHDDAGPSSAPQPRPVVRPVLATVSRRGGRANRCPRASARPCA
jgi:arabinan endo-1,5-alpha-L-arabinosidase